MRAVHVLLPGVRRTSMRKGMSTDRNQSDARRGLILGVAAMTLIVAASNLLVQYPINDWLTWGAFTYPVSFLVNDLTNRHLGPGRARRVVYAGFAVGVLLSVMLSTPRIAAASGLAFLSAQLLDVSIFNRLRQGAWWRAAPGVVGGGLGAGYGAVLQSGLCRYRLAVDHVGRRRPGRQGRHGRCHAAAVLDPAPGHPAPGRGRGRLTVRAGTPSPSGKLYGLRGDNAGEQGLGAGTGPGGARAIAQTFQGPGGERPVLGARGFHGRALVGQGPRQGEALGPQRRFQQGQGDDIPLGVAAAETVGAVANGAAAGPPPKHNPRPRKAWRARQKGRPISRVMPTLASLARLT